MGLFDENKPTPTTEPVVEAPTPETVSPVSVEPTPDFFNEYARLKALFEEKTREYEEKIKELKQEIMKTYEQSLNTRPVDELMGLIEKIKGGLR